MRFVCLFVCRIMRNKCVSSLWSHLWCLMQNKDGSSLLTWMGLWKTLWKFIKIGSLWMFGLTMRKRSLRTSNLNFKLLSNRSLHKLVKSNWHLLVNWTVFQKVGPILTFEWLFWEVGIIDLTWSSYKFIGGNVGDRHELGLIVMLRVVLKFGWCLNHLGVLFKSTDCCPLTYTSPVSSRWMVPSNLCPLKDSSDSHSSDCQLGTTGN